MQEELISLETAKLAKDKGYNIPSDPRFYYKDFYTGWTSSNKGAVLCDNKEEGSICRPSQSLLQKWLREVHSIDVFVTKLGTSNEKKYFFRINKENHWLSTDNSNSTTYLKFEEALEIGLQEGLKLI
jgi:hypothetical protein